MDWGKPGNNRFVIRMKAWTSISRFASNPKRKIRTREIQIRG